MRHAPVTDLEIVEDLTPTARCVEPGAFLHLRRLRMQNRRADGSVSAVYRVDVVDRPRLDAVAVLVWRRGDAGIELLTRQVLRPAAYLRKEKTPPLPDGRSHLTCEEIVAGVLEPTDVGEAGLRHRAVEEVREEAGFEVAPGELELLGAPFFVAPGIISEKIYLAAVEVTGRPHEPASGDGSPLEEGGALRWRSVENLHAAIEAGEVQDAKTELALRRFLERHG